MAQLMAMPPKKRKYDEPYTSPSENARDAARPIVPLVGAGVSNKGFGSQGITPGDMGVTGDALGGMDRPMAAPPATPQSLPAPAAPAPPAPLSAAPLPVEIQAQQANTGVLNSLTQQQNADTQGVVDRMAAIPTIQADFGGDVGAFQRAQALQASGAAGMVPRAQNLSYGGAPIRAYNPGFTNDDQRRIFAENQSLSVRQAKARDLRGRMREDAGALIRTGTPEGIQAAGGILQQRSQVETPRARTVYDLQGEREQMAHEQKMAEAGGRSSSLDTAREVTRRTMAQEDARNARQEAGFKNQEQRQQAAQQFEQRMAEYKTTVNRMDEGTARQFQAKADKVRELRRRQTELYRDANTYGAGKTRDSIIAKADAMDKDIAALEQELDQAAKAAAPAQGGTAFNSVEEAERAKLPKGTRITINGRPAIVE